MIGTLVDILIAAFVLIGALLALVAALGLLRLPDLYTRMHAASKAGTAGSGILLVAVAIQSGEFDVWVKSLLAIAFIFLTAPVSAHLLAKAEVQGGQRLPGPEGEAENAANPAGGNDHDPVITGFHNLNQ